MVYAPLGAFVASISGNITVYCVIMQFNTVPLDKVNSDCLRFAVSVFQLNCTEYIKLKHRANQKMMEIVVVAKPAKISTASKTGQTGLDTPATNGNNSNKPESTPSALQPTPTPFNPATDTASMLSPMPSAHPQMQISVTSSSMSQQQ
eukprot:CAMPEP_0197028124 /NCGR_PEP_ID=MMETSP1384-20130603/7895_1 /TAXON_ID=29189 /ORGANISM="Ammonia sp." /LENGTH=147 /DNA_ID=CAMNT_0042457077 /DNA_START=796 /DNA_END=1239 /DNA_ORIENTATION=+